MINLTGSPSYVHEFIKIFVKLIKGNNPKIVFTSELSFNYAVVRIQPSFD